ncbi:MAG TPA: hypothetical protein VFD03_04390 [Clostridia bacterium]|nr:hypothetical protein [Clostridia bacterium]
MTVEQGQLIIDSLIKMETIGFTLIYLTFVMIGCLVASAFYGFLRRLF